MIWNIYNLYVLRKIREEVHNAWHTSKNEIRSPAIPKKWENISEKTPNRLHNPRNGGDSFINLCLGWLHLLNIFHVILGANFSKSSTKSLAYSINNHHPKYKAPMHFPRKHAKPLDGDAETVPDPPFGFIFLHRFTIWIFLISLLLHYHTLDAPFTAKIKSAWKKLLQDLFFQLHMIGI